MYPAVSKSKYKLLTLRPGAVSCRGLHADNRPFKPGKILINSIKCSTIQSFTRNWIVLNKNIWQNNINDKTRDMIRLFKLLIPGAVSGHHFLWPGACAGPSIASGDHITRRQTCKRCSVEITLPSSKTVSGVWWRSHHLSADL